MLTHPIDSHIVSYQPVYTAIFWYPAIERSNMQPLLIKKVNQTSQFKISIGFAALFKFMI